MLKARPKQSREKKVRTSLCLEVTALTQHKRVAECIETTSKVWHIGMFGRVSRILGLPSFVAASRASGNSYPLTSAAATPLGSSTRGGRLGAVVGVRVRVHADNLICNVVIGQRIGIGVAVRTGRRASILGINVVPGEGRGNGVGIGTVMRAAILAFEVLHHATCLVRTAGADRTGAGLLHAAGNGDADKRLPLDWIDTMPSPQAAATP